MIINDDDDNDNDDMMIINDNGDDDNSNNYSDNGDDGDDDDSDDNNVDDDNNLKIYGISQNPVTKNYIMVFPIEYYCKICGEKYTSIKYKWCKLCHLKTYFTNNNISGNEKIDIIIQEFLLKINQSSDILFEWIPYN